jgi:hypothetical protein
MSRFMSVALVMTLAAVPMARAQSDPSPKVLSACYVPEVGLVYRIGEPGLPDHCLGPKHVQFSWNAEGPKGEKGDQGDPGPPGTASLAGHVCPAGTFVIGFDSSGGLLCSVIDEANPPPTNPFEGMWTFDPAVVMECPGTPIGAVNLNVSGLTTRLVSADQMVVTLDYGVDFLPGEVLPPISFSVPFDPQLQTFSGSGPFTIAPYPMSIGGSFSGEGSLSIDAHVVSPTLIEGTFRASLTLSFHTILGSTTVHCTDVDVTVQATRS